MHACLHQINGYISARRVDRSYLVYLNTTDLNYLPYLKLRAPHDQAGMIDCTTAAVSLRKDWRYIASHSTYHIELPVRHPDINQ